MSLSRSVISSSGKPPVSTRVLEKVAKREGTSPLEFDQLLSDVLDPDALDALFRTENADGYVEFVYAGYSVRVDSDGHITVSDPAE